MPSDLAMVGVIGAGLPTVLAFLLLSGIGVVLWSREHPPQETLTARGDVPLRLLQWAVGLLSADRGDWGQAMLGELDQIERRSTRWRFVLGCMAGVVLVPPSGATGPMAALTALALGSAVVFGIGFVHFGLATNPWNWIMLVILAVLVMGSLIAVSVQLRRPGAVGLGLVGAIFVAAAWLGFSGFTYTGLISPIDQVSSWSGMVLFVVVPLVVGVVGAWNSGSASVGRRAARLAGVSAGLAMFFAATIAVVAIDGGPRDPGAGVAGGVSEAFSNVAMLFLIGLPLATAAFGWVAATSTARIRTMALAQRKNVAVSTPQGAGRAVDGARSRTTGSTLRRVAVAVAFLLAVVVFMQAR